MKNESQGFDVIMHNLAPNNVKWLQSGSTGHLNKLRNPVTY